MPSITSPDHSQPLEASGPERSTYAHILKSSMIMGSSSVVNICLGIVRTKVMALLLGPSGVGLIGLYSSALEFAQNIVGLGVNNSGVRQIAEAVGSGKSECVARTVIVLRRIAFLLGVSGAVLLITVSRQVSVLTFGTEGHANAVALLSIAILFASISGGQAALIQGMRRIKDLGKMSVLGTFFGTSLSVPLIYCFGEDGIVPSLIGGACITFATSWWYSRKVVIRDCSMSLKEMGEEASALLKLGVAFMASGILMVGSTYAIRTMIAHLMGLPAAGIYQAAWTLGSLYIGFILQSMGADFYPRLSAIASNNEECNRLVNEQAQISLLLAGPGVMGTLTFAPLAIALFYSSEFTAAVIPLRWICLGLILRVIAWPMGCILLARRNQLLFFLTELAAATVHLGLAWIGVHHFGLAGVGVAFFGLYIWHTGLIYAIVRQLTGFRWSVPNRQNGLVVLSLITFVFCGFFAFSLWVATGIGTAATLYLSLYSLRGLLMLFPVDRMPATIQPFVAIFSRRIGA